MIRSLKLLLLLVISFSTSVYATDSVECKFTTYMSYANGKADYDDYYHINQYLKIIDSQTTDNTLSLDGSERAVNSKRWVQEDNYNLVYTGNLGEILSIQKDSKLGNFFNAHLISFGIKEGSITERKGICSVSD